MRLKLHAAYSGRRATASGVRFGLRIQSVDATPRLSELRGGCCHEAQNEDPVHRSGQGFDVGALATGRVAAHDRSALRSLPYFDWWDALEERRDTAAVAMSRYVSLGFGWTRGDIPWRGGWVL